MQNLIIFNFTHIDRYETCIDTEIQQRVVEYFALSRKGEALMDILAEMPKFPERESSLIKKAEDTEVDTTELSAIKSRTQQQASNALVVTSEREPPQLGMVKIPSFDHNSVSVDQELTQTNGISHEVDHPQPDILGDLLSPLAIEAPPPPVSEDDALALAPVEEQDNIVKPIGDTAERFHALCLKDSGVLYEDPYVQIGIKADWRGHQGRLVIFLGNKTTSSLTSVQAVVLPPSYLKLELSSAKNKLQTMQTMVFVVHTQPSLTAHLFSRAKELGMMGEGYMWIITSKTTNLLNSMDAEAIKLMQGAVGFRSYFPASRKLHNFASKWREEHYAINKRNHFKKVNYRLHSSKNESRRALE
ncbi:AP-2 complex subunit alpha-1-like [Lactuca sativa]|nr:AP-2 complex subunit alpha-1-like [Lactuca sativa]